FCQTKNDKMAEPNGSAEVEHSVLTDPTFAKLKALQHAEICTKTFFIYPNCAETIFLLKHIGRCNKENCKYQDCSISRVLLDHSNGGHRNLSNSPLCKKQEVIKRLHSGKGPRAEEEDEEEIKDKENDEKKEDERMKAEDVDDRMEEDQADTSGEANMDEANENDKKEAEPAGFY
ncbi:hypothetical protein PENTCL1PPCAC_9969, partial [Pristionchus entomophagus]